MAVGGHGHGGVSIGWTGILDLARAYVFATLSTSVYIGIHDILFKP